MGRYCYLYLDDVAVSCARPFVPDEWRAVFQETDRVGVGHSSDDTVSGSMVYEGVDKLTVIDGFDRHK